MIVSDPLRAFIETMPQCWQIVSFGEMLTEPVRNGIYKSKEFHGRGVRVVNMGELFAYEFISEQEMKRVEITGTEVSRFGLQDGDLLFARRSLVFEGSGKCSLVVCPKEPTTFESSIIRARPNRSLMEPKFLYYLFASPLGRAIVASIATRTAVSGIRGSDLVQVGLPRPPLPVQQRIAGILSAYDDLIENNQRRIKILESMARALYREWFVNFRFPGHEGHSRDASPLGEIPKGWEVKRLDEFCRSIQDGDWIETKDQGGEDFRLLQISNVGVGEFVETGNFRYVTKATFSRLRCTEIEPGDLLVARMPTPIGRGWLVSKMPWRMITAVDVAIVKAEQSVVHPLFLVQAWNEPMNLNRIAAQASGTTRLRITRRELAAMEFVVPPFPVQRQFASIIEPQAAMIDVLRQKIENLRRTRDLLLPRLLSGQIDVEVA